MRRLGELVLRHRVIIVIAWAVILVAGGAVSGTVSDRMTVNFSLPGQPGDEAANKIIAAYHNGGNTAPLIATVTMPEGETITGNEDEVAKAFASIATAVPDRPLRVVDEANTGDKAFRTVRRPHGVRDGVLPVPAELRRAAPDETHREGRAVRRARRRPGRA